MKHRQDLMRYHHTLGEMRAAVDAIEHTPGCADDIALRLRKASGLIAAAASGINSALRLTLPDEVEAAR